MPVYEKLTTLVRKNQSGIFVACLCLMVYFRAFSAEFVSWDDNVLVLENPLLQLPFFEASKKSLTVYFHGDFFPVTLMSYWIDFQVAGFDSVYMHSVNLALHVVTGLLLLGLLTRLSGNSTLALCVVVIFALHPVQAESVMWISERKGLLSALFTVLSLRAYLTSLERPSVSIAFLTSMLFYILATLSKASGILIPVLFLALELMYSKIALRASLKRLLPFLIVCVGLSTLRIFAYSSATGTSGFGILENIRWMEVPFKAFGAIEIYLKMFVFPWGLSAIYPDFQMTVTSISVSIICAIAVTLYSIKVLKEKNRFRVLCWVWFLIFLLPVLHLVPRINYVNDRYLYLPIIGLSGLIFSYIKPQYQRMIGFASVVLMSLQTIAVTDHWTTSMKLWANAVSIVPENNIALSNQALEFQRRGQLEAAATAYEKILQRGNDTSTRNLAYNNLANIYTDRKFKGFSLSKAIELLRRGIQDAVNTRDTYEMRLNLGMALAASGQYSDAVSILNELSSDLKIEKDYRFSGLGKAVDSHLENVSKLIKPLGPHY